MQLSAKGREAALRLVEISRRNREISHRMAQLISQGRGCSGEAMALAEEFLAGSSQTESSTRSTSGPETSMVRTKSQ